MNHLFLKIIKTGQALFKANYEFKLPARKDTIVLDLDNAYYFKKLFNKNKTDFLDTRYKKFNIIILIYTVFICILNFNRNLLRQYIINYIKFINSKNIITFTDNNLFFLSLKNFFPKKNIIIFQYAWNTRLSFDDMYLQSRKNKNFKKFKIDHTCIWGKNSKNFYSKFIDTKYTITGSIKNNFFNHKNNLKKDSIIFISQFRMHFDYDIKNKTYKKNIFKDTALKNILKYCKEKNLKLKILGCAKEKSYYEKNYFNHLLGKKNFTFLKRSSGLSSYTHSLKYKYFITFCSSLAYEFMCVGKRAAFLPWKEQFLIKNKNLKFDASFYSYKKKSGPMWSNSCSSKEIFRVLNHVVKSKENVWEKITEKLIKPIVIYDKNNKKTKALFSKIGLN